jgi:hypothetical protein
MKANGTVTGNQQITNIAGGGIDDGLTVLDGFIHMRTGTGELRPGIWRTDGTTQNVIKIVETSTNYDYITANPINSDDGSHLIKLNNKILFIGNETFNSFPGPTRYGREIRFIVDNGICNEQTSLKSGNWNDPTVWSCGIIPTVSQEILIKSQHTVTLLPSMGQQSCKNLRFEVGGRLINKGILVFLQP